MNYLLPADYVSYGLTAETPDAWIAAASAMIDSYCRRPTLAAASYTERLRVGRGLPTVRVSYTPLVSVTSVSARFKHRGSGLLGCDFSGGFGSGTDDGFGFGEVIAGAFCAPGTWTPIDPSTLDLDLTTGEIGLPLNLLGGRYSEAEVTYVAGLSTITDPVKFACVQLVKNAQATPALNVKSSRVDTLQMQYFSSSLFDPQVTALLQPFVAERLG